MSSGDIKTTNPYHVQKAGYLSVVGNDRADAAHHTITAGRRMAPATQFAAPVATRAPREKQGVEAIAQQYDTFEEALLPMVLASGVTGAAAPAVADAIIASPALRSQAEAAFRAARIRPV